MAPEVDYVEVQLELGHHAVPKTKPGTDFTHFWTLFVRGPDDCKIEEFVDKVVFNLHSTFDKFKRVYREPPFIVKEFGYGGFELPIDIYFKNKEEPKKITYVYDLFLDNFKPVTNTRREKLTFQNPSPEFKKKLLRAGGRCYSDGIEKTIAQPVASKSKAKPASPLTPASNPPASPVRDSKPQSGQKVGPGNPKHRVPQKDIASHSKTTTAVPSICAAAAPTKQISDKAASVKNVSKPDPFTDLFGPPLQCRPSPDPVKQKERSRKGRAENESQSKVKQEPKEPTHSSKTGAASVKSSSRTSSPSHSHEKGEKIGKQSKSKKKKKESRSSSSPESDTGVRHNSSRKCDYKGKAESNEDNKRTKVKGKDMRSAGTAATTSASSNSSQKSKDVKKENFTSTTISFSNNNNTGTTTLEIKSVKKEKTWDSESKKTKSREENEKSAAADQRAVSTSPTSVASDANGIRDDVSPAAAGNRRKRYESGSESDAGRDKKWKCDGSSDDEIRSTTRQKYLTDLLWIQKRINETTDPIMLQLVADAIENSKAEFEMTETCLEFDLKRLDDATLSKLRLIVEKG